jgi:GTP-binding protein LepA
MGFGFRCGFLGMLHMEIVQERLEREYNLDLIVTAPSVIYRVTTNTDEILMVDNPSELPPPNSRKSIEEPYVKLEIMTPQSYIGTLMELCVARRGVFVDTKYITTERATLIYELPLAEMVTDFFDQMKSRTKGYASMEYQVIGYRPNDLVLVDILVNEEPVDALACIVHRDKSYNVGRALVSKLRELIPKQQFQIPIQAAIGTKILARENISALRKNVLSKCYGGDVSRKKKLLEKQKKGKKRMKSIGTVEVPQAAFMAILQLNGD